MLFLFLLWLLNSGSGSGIFFLHWDIVDFTLNNTIIVEFQKKSKIWLWFIKKNTHTQWWWTLYWMFDTRWIIWIIKSTTKHTNTNCYDHDQQGFVRQNLNKRHSDCLVVLRLITNWKNSIKSKCFWMIIGKKCIKH